MKKIITLILILTLAISSSVFAAPQEKIFTHPELGEQMTAGFENGNRPYFQIYGYYYYRFMGVTEQYRDLNAVADYKKINSQPSSRDAIKKIISSIENDKSIEKIFLLNNTDEFNEILKELDSDEKVDFISALYGFDGADGYEKLSAKYKDNPTISALKENYSEYNVKIENKIYPFRVLKIKVVKDKKNNDSYFENYSFVKTEDEWRLLNITHEYTNEYKERSKYVHGLASLEPTSAKDIVESLIGDITFKTTKNEFSKMLETKINEDSVTLKDDEVFGLYTYSTYTFKNDVLDKITYTFANLESYYSCFISLYTRFTEPCEIKEDGTMIWSTNELLIKLTPNEPNPTLEITTIKGE